MRPKPRGHMPMEARAMWSCHSLVCVHTSVVSCRAFANSRMFRHMDCRMDRGVPRKENRAPVFMVVFGKSKEPFTKGMGTCPSPPADKTTMLRMSGNSPFPTIPWSFWDTVIYRTSGRRQQLAKTIKAHYKSCDRHSRQSLSARSKHVHARFLWVHQKSAIRRYFDC